MATTPSLASSFSLLQKQAPSPTPINWGAINVKPATTAPSFSLGSKPAMPAMNMGIQTSTPATATPINTFSNPTPAMPSTSNSQSQDTALRPGQFGAGPFATIKADGTSTPSAYAQSPVMPSVSAPAATPVAKPAPYVQTASGATADPNTGAMVTPAAAQNEAAATVSNTGNAGSTANYSSAAGGSPVMPYTGGGSYDPMITSPEAEDLFKKYKDSLTPGADELAATDNLNRLNIAAATAYTDTQNQPIALPFITGQQAAQQRSQNLLAQPLEQQIALAQAKRQTAATVSKAALDRMDAQTKAKRDMAAPVSVGSGSSLIDPTTGKPIYTAPGAADTKAPTTMETEKGILQWDPNQKAWVSTGFAGTKVADKTAATKASAQAAQILGNSLIGTKEAPGKIGQAIAMVGNTTAGPLGAVSQNIPGTAAYNLNKIIDTIRANLGFQALADMRAQSPTGGALGQVTERELNFLQSTVSSLDQGQSPAQLKQSLEDIQTHFQNWQDAVTQAAQTGGGSSSSGTGSGGQYDW